MSLADRTPAGGWRWVFFATIVLYALVYAPYGINETDGGFLTGLAWQVLQGKVLYHDLVYVRPPLPVWLRALQLHWLPIPWAILGERWIFYGQVALYSWLAAATLTTGRSRWQLATFGFVVSVHCYPAAAWHTVDGILFAVLAAWLLFQMPGRWGSMAAGAALFAALLCKQSFYPLLVFAPIAAYFSPQRWRAMAGLLAGFSACTALFFNYLYQNDLISGFLRLTNGAANSGQAWQHGVVDYFRIQPVLAVLSVTLLFPVLIWYWRGRFARLAGMAWLAWLLLLMGSYALAIWYHQDFSPPFAQSRLLFWLAAGYWIGRIIQNSRSVPPVAAPLFPPAFGLLLAVSWCAAVSWGYNLPILFATPGVWAALDISRQLQAGLRSSGWRGRSDWLVGLALVALLGLFRWGYEFVYRDGRRSAMTEELGSIFPALRGIRSDAETAALYRDLRSLTARYGPNCKTLPAFPQANFLTNTPSPLPLDWVVTREMNADSAFVLDAFRQEKPVLLLEKRYLAAILTDPQLTLVRRMMQEAVQLEETSFFLVMQYGDRADD